jgi:hypothetical protein
MTTWVSACRVAAPALVAVLLADALGTARPAGTGTVATSVRDVADVIRAIVTAGEETTGGLFSETERDHLAALYAPGTTGRSGRTRRVDRAVTPESPWP